MVLQPPKHCCLKFVLVAEFYNSPKEKGLRKTVGRRVQKFIATFTYTIGVSEKLAQMVENLRAEIA